MLERAFCVFLKALGRNKPEMCCWGVLQRFRGFLSIGCTRALDERNKGPLQGVVV